MKNYLQCKKIETAINRAKKTLIEEVKNNGLYECFGQKEVRQIQDKFIDTSDYTDKMNLNRTKLENFDNWCMSYTGN